MRKLLLSLAILVGGSAVTQLAQAEYFGLLNGRSADLTGMSDLSVEAGFVTGDLDGVDYDHIGLRVNYRVLPGLIVFGDLGKSDLESFDDTTLGVGAFYQLQDLLNFADSSVKASYHSASFSQAGFFDIDLDVLAVELLISGLEPISDSGIEWYASLGIHRLDGDSGIDSDTEPALTAGVTIPVGPGTAYVGFEHVDETTFGGGFRYDIF